MQQEGKKKIIFGIVAAVIVIIIIVLAGVVIKNDKVDNNKANNSSKVENSSKVDNSSKVNSNSNTTSGQTEKLTLESVNVDDSKNNKKEDPWEDVSIIEETKDDGYLKDKDGNPVTTKKGKKKKEEYPGQNEGWSPIVPAEEVEND